MFSRRRGNSRYLCATAIWMYGSTISLGVGGWGFRVLIILIKFRSLPGHPIKDPDSGYSWLAVAHWLGPRQEGWIHTNPRPTYCDKVSALPPTVQ